MPNRRSYRIGVEDGAEGDANVVRTAVEPIRASVAGSYRHLTRYHPA